jgi:hypothetical protein
VILRSALYALIAWAAGAAITLVLYLGTMQWEREDVIRATLRTSSAAVWFAPSVILLTALSPAAIAAAMVLVITATRLLYYEWRIQQPPPLPLPRPSGLFATLEPPSRTLARLRPRARGVVQHPDGRGGVPPAPASARRRGVRDERFRWPPSSR